MSQKFSCYRPGLDGVDFINLPAYDMNDADLHEFFVFAICVANKQASTIAPRVRHLRRILSDPMLQGLCGLQVPQLASRLKELGIGNFNIKALGLSQAAALWAAGKLDLRKTSLAELEAIAGVGPKTSRFFLLHTSREARYAVLDTHLLKWLAQQGHDVPKATPSGKRYLQLEQLVLAAADAAGLSAAQFDITRWKQFAIPEDS